MFNKVNGQPSKGLVMCEYDDTVIAESSFTNWGVDTAVWGRYYENTGVLALQPLDDGKILVGGSFSSFGGEPYHGTVCLKPSGFVGMDETAVNQTLKIVPNPAQDYIRIQLPNQSAYNARVAIYDLSRRLVKETVRIDTSGKVNIAELNSGMYLVRVVSDAGVFTGKFSVE